MSLLDTLKDFARIKPRRKPTSRIAGGGNLESWSITEDWKKRYTKKDLQSFYYKSSLVFSGINLLTNSCLGRGFYLKSDNDKALAICKDAIETPSFKPTLLDAVSHTLIYGDSFIELIWGENSKWISNYKIMDPLNTIPKYDDVGDILYYKQKNLISGTDQEFQEEQVAFFRFWRIGDSVRGIGLVEPLIPTLLIELDIEESIRDAIKRFANPPLRLVIKDDPVDPVTDKEIEALEEKYKNFDRKKFFGSTDRISIDFINLYKAFPDLSFQINHVLNKICAGLRVPKPILLAAGETVNRATLDGLIDFHQYEISLIQEKIGHVLEDQIFTPLCRRNGLDVIPDVHWFRLSTQDESEQAINYLRTARAVSQLYKDGIMNQEDALALLIKHER